MIPPIQSNAWWDPTHLAYNNRQTIKQKEDVSGKAERRGFIRPGYLLVERKARGAYFLSLPKRIPYIRQINFLGNVIVEQHFARITYPWVLGTSLLQWRVHGLELTCSCVRAVSDALCLAHEADLHNESRRRKKGLRDSASGSRVLIPFAPYIVPTAPPPGGWLDIKCDGARWKSGGMKFVIIIVIAGFSLQWSES